MPQPPSSVKTSNVISSPDSAEIENSVGYRLHRIDTRLQDGFENINKKLEELFVSRSMPSPSYRPYSDTEDAIRLTSSASQPSPAHQRRDKETKTNRLLKSVSAKMLLDSDEMSHQMSHHVTGDTNGDRSDKRVSFVTSAGDPTASFASFAFPRLVKMSTKDSVALNVRTRAERMHEIHSTIMSYQQRRGRYAFYVWRTLENPHSSRSAYLYAGLLPCIVIGSVFLSFWATVDVCPISSANAEIVQTICETIFAIEFVLRFLVCPDRIDFWKSPFNYVDLLTILPLGFRMIVGVMSATGDSETNAEEVLSKLALLPVLRLLKLTRRFEKFQLLLSAFLIAVEALPVLLYTLLIIALIFAALIFFVEPTDNIEDLPHAIWFVVVTMTTVGYGDITPTTLGGHILTTTLMIISSLYMAIPIGIVGNAFSTVWSARDRLLLMHRMQNAFLQQGFSAKALATIVTMFDGSGSGELSLDDFELMLEAMHIHINRARVMQLWDSFDEDGSGTVSVDELLNGLFPQDYAQFFNNLTAVPAISESKATLNADVELKRSEIETRYSNHSRKAKSNEVLE